MTLESCLEPTGPLPIGVSQTRCYANPLPNPSADRLAQLLDTTVSYTCERIQPQHVPGQFARPKTQNPEPHSEAAAFLRAAQAALSEGDQPGDNAPEEGIQVASFLRWGSLEAFEPPFVGHSVHMRKHWGCPICGEKLLVNLKEIEEHLQTHEGSKKSDWVAEATALASQAKGGRALPDRGKRPPEREERALLGEVDRVETVGVAAGDDVVEKEEKSEGGSNVQRRRYLCEECGGKVYLFTPPQILQHKRTHR